MASKEEVVIIYDKSLQQTGCFVDWIKRMKFVNSLSKNVSCKVISIEDFSKLKGLRRPLKFCKTVLFLQDAAHITEIVGGVRQNFDVEESVKLKVITSEAGKAKLEAWTEMVNAEDIIACDRLDDIAKWYPSILVFLFGKSMEREPGGKKGASLFMFDDGNALETEWFKRTTHVIRQFGKVCLWTGDAEEVARHGIGDLDCVVIVSKGNGDQVWAKCINTIDRLAQSPKIQFLIVTDNPTSNTVKDLTNRTDGTVVYKCDKDLDLNYRVWTSLLQKLSLIDCRDVTLPSKAVKILKVVGITLAVLLIGIPLFVFLGFGFCCICFRTSNKSRRRGYVSFK